MAPFERSFCFNITLGAVSEPTVEMIDQAIVGASEYSSMTVDGETVAHQSLDALMRARRELKREEELQNGTRGSVATFNLSRQSF